jgi:hypothetical protein
MATRAEKSNKPKPSCKSGKRLLKETPRETVEALTGAALAGVVLMFFPVQGLAQTLDGELFKRAFEVVVQFETSGKGWAKITGDFDRNGVSCGVLQWNIGRGSLHREL